MQLIKLEDFLEVTRARLSGSTNLKKRETEVLKLYSRKSIFTYK